MRKSLLILTSVVATLFACKEQPKTIEKPTTKVIVTGTIKNPKSNKLSFTFNSNLLTGKDSVLAFDSLDENNSFKVEFDLENPVFGNFNTSKEYTNIYLSPGDSINITLDANAFDSTITYFGNGGQANNYLAKKLSNGLGWNEMIVFYALDQAEFIVAIDSILASEISALQSAGIENTTFIESQKENLSYLNALNFVNYDDYNAHATQRDSSITLNDDLVAKINSIDVNNEKSISNKNYNVFLNSYFNYKLQILEDSNRFEFQNQIAYIDDFFTNAKIIELLKAQLIYNTINNEGLTKEIQTALSEFKQKNTSSSYISTLDITAKKWEHLMEGKPAPTFAYHDKGGNTITLEDLKGNFIYIDVWATWCGPCRREAPSFQQLTEDFKGQNITFLGISIDENEEAWMKYLIKKEPTSTQVIADMAWKSSICKDYNINGIPRFILIDDEGNIINANAKRPSGGIRKQLNSLLNKNS